LSDLLWDLETEGRPADTPERRASIEQALRARVAQIGDRVVRDYYANEMRNRVDKLRLPERTWQPRRRRGGFANAGPNPAPFVAGMAARRAEAELDTFPEERALLGALIDRPALLHVVADELSKLPIASPDLDRLRNGLLDALATVPAGVEPAADEALGDAPLEERLIGEHLQRAGLGRIAETARTKARRLFRDDPRDPDGWVGQWRHAAHRMVQKKADLEELERAEQALAEDYSEENLQLIKALTDRFLRESRDPGTG
jgi:DNA primase